ncbi:MFS transporter [Streptomyces sp. NPDC046203]|uniref:MFS transporter n=1 Tax=Streptomyces sp. NPDC046203 TaxID=3154602 RepID=UPI0033D65071
MAKLSLGALLPGGSARKPVLLLALGSFALGTDSFVISGVLPELGDDLGVSLGTAGLLITVFSAVYAVGAPVLAVATGRVSRRKVLIGSLTVFVLANLLAAVAVGYPLMMAARVIAALSASVYMPTATAAAAAVSAPEERGRALSAVLGGLTVANALGVPLGTLVGQSAGWRGTFALVTVIGVIALAGILRTLDDIPSPGVASLRQRVAVAKVRGVPSTLLATALAMCGVFVLYSYLAWFFDRAAGVHGGMLTLIYLISGITAVVSNLAAGWMIDHMPPTRVAAISMGGLTVASLGMALMAGLFAPGIGAAITLSAGLAVWSLIGWLFNPAQQQRLLAAAGPRGPIALSLNSSAIFAGQAVAGILGGLALGGGPAALALVAAGCVAVAVVLLGVSHVRTRPAGPPVTSDSPAGAAGTSGAAVAAK